MGIDLEQRDIVDETLGYRGGLVHAFRMDGRGGGSKLGWPEIDADPLGNKIEGDIWIHMNRAAPRVQQWLTETARVPEQAAEMLLVEDPRPKFVHFPADESHPEGFVLILRGVNLNPNADPENMVSIRLWVDQHRVISLRRRKVMAVGSMRDALLKGTGAASSVDLVNLLIAALVDRIDPVVDELEADLDRAEDRLEEADLARVRTEIGEVRRSAIRLRRYLAPQRDILMHAGPELPAWVTKKEKLRLRAKAERVARVLEDIDELMMRAGFAHEELHARLDERMNRISTGLTIVATIFLPMGLIASMWGMNTDGLPLARGPMGFWLVTAIIIVVGAMLALFGWKMSRLK
jgi:zinc transporter